MPRKKKDEGGGGAGSWLNTYADMVTLLLTFFILLFSISNLDKDKYAAFAEAFSKGNSVVVAPPDAEVGEELLDPGSVEDTPIIEEEDMESLDVLYEKMSEFVEENQLESEIVIEQSQAGILLTFDNGVFFDGDSSVLKEEGKVILDAVTDGIYEAGDAVSDVIVAGHTAEILSAEDDGYDRILSSDRALNVLLYMEGKDLIEPAKMVSVGYGRHQPVASNDTPEGMAANRRAEIFIVDAFATSGSGDGDSSTGEPGVPESDTKLADYIYGILKSREFNLNNR